MKILAFVCLSARSISAGFYLSASRVRRLVLLLACALPAANVLCFQAESQTAHFTPATGVNFGSVNVRNVSVAVPLSFTFDTAGKLGNITVLTQGITGLDFADTGTGTCTTNGAAHTYNPGETCTVDVTFSPKYPGTRYGAAVLKDTVGNAIATGYVYGTGIAPQVVFLPGALTTIASTGLNHPTGVAVDANGIVYVTDTLNNRVLKETPSGANYTESVLLSIGLNSPFGIAVDGAGNLYIVDALNRRILKETLSVGGYTETVLVATSLHGPTGVAVDGSGNVYYADSPSNSGNLGVQRIVKKTLLGGVYTDSTVADVSTGLDNPIGVAVDGAGNVYIADTDIAKVWKETPSGTAYTQTTVGSGLNQPHGVAVDGQGNVYIADRGNLRVLKETPSGTTYTETTLATALAPWGMAVDASGNLYIDDYDESTVLKLDMADPPTLNFADINVGATSTDSPQTVTVQNIGNANLTFPIPSAGRNPSISAGFTLGGSGTCPQLTTSSFGPGTLTPGSGCTLPVSFVPAAPGINHGSLVLTDDALNATPSTNQTVLLNGTGLGAGTPQAVLSPVSVSFGSITTGTTSAAQTVTLSNPGTAALSITSISITGTNLAQFAQTSTCGASLAIGSSCTISVTFTPAAVASYSAAISVADNATGSPQTVSLTGSGIAPAAPQAVLSPASLPFGSLTTGTTSAAQTVTLSNPGTAALSITGISITGANTAQFAQTSNCGASLAAGASCVISITFTPSAVASYSAAISVADNATGSPQSVPLTGAGVSPPPTDFSIGASNSPQTVARGTNVQYPITLTPLGGAFSSVITLSTSGLPTGATASFSPATVTPGGNPGNSTLTVTTSNIASLSAPHFGSSRSGGQGAVIALALLLLPWIKAKRMRQSRARLLSAAVLLVGTIGLWGCGSGGFAAHSQQTYILTVTGTSGSTQHATTVTLTVK